MVRKTGFCNECHVFYAAAYTDAIPVYTFYVITQELQETANPENRTIFLGLSLYLNPLVCRKYKNERLN